MFRAPTAPAPTLNTSPLQAHHQRSGARLTPPDHGSTLLTYGDVPAEYRAGSESALLLDVSTRGALRLTGSDAASFLQRITANDVRGLSPGEGCSNLLLTGKGKVVSTFDLSVEEEGQILVSTPPGCAPGLAEALDMYLFTDDVELADVTEEHAPLEICGPRAAEVVTAALGSAPPEGLHEHALVDGVRVTCLPVAGGPGWRMDAGPGGAESLWLRLIGAGAVPGGLVARDGLRVEAGAAEWSRDVDDTVYPQEARLEGSFSLDKGCYIGQEVVAKIDTYGGLNKRLHALRVDHDDPVPPGTRLMREQDGEWRDLGVVTSWAYSFALDGGVVLGYVKRKHQDTGTEFRLGDGPGKASIVGLPLRPGTLHRPEEESDPQAPRG